MSDRSTDGSDYPEAMYEQLADLCRSRFYSAQHNDGLTEEQAWREIIHIILDTYREALAS